jgi:hypothetical protein
VTNVVSTAVTLSSNVCKGGLELVVAGRVPDDDEQATATKQSVTDATLMPDASLASASIATEGACRGRIAPNYAA